MNIAICLTLLAAASAAAPVPPVIADRARPLPLAAVRLNAGPLKRAQDLDALFLLQLEPERMLAPFRKQAGLPPRAEGYGGWEAGGRNLTGHLLGHYLSAVSQMWAATGDVRFKQRVDTIVAELEIVQDANQDGYLGALDGGRECFAEVARGDIRSSRFDLNGLWSPWYTLHKLYAGLRDAYRLTGNRTALALEVKFAEWAEGILSELTDAEVRKMLATEFRGMNEVLVDLYFRTMGVQMFQRRDFTPGGEPGARPVAIVNRAFARLFCQDSRAIGERIRLFYGDGQPREIIAVVADLKHFGLGEETRPEIYVPYRQHPWPFLTLVLRTAGNPINMVSFMRSEVVGVDNDQPLDRVLSMTQILGGTIAQPRFYGLLLGASAVLALIAAAVGVYGLTTYWASLRAREIAVRVAMGARPADILTLFVWVQLKLTLLGTAIGAVAAFALARLLTGWLYGITAADPWTFLGIAGVLILTSLLAAFLPAQRAAAQGPAVVLRSE